LTKRSSKPAAIHENGAAIPHASKIRPLQVTDTWPDKMPVTLAELEAIETWLKPLLDEIMGGGNG